MYYLDFHQLYAPTTTEQRREMRRRLIGNRDEIMAKKLKHQHNSCFYCAEQIDMSSHLDHVIPIYYGGSSRLANLVAACKSCNMTKLTDQIEISNPYTINDYLKLQEAYAKWLSKRKKAKGWVAKNKLDRYQPKRVRLYHIYRADLFKSIGDKVTIEIK